MPTATIDLTALIIPFAVGCVGFAGIVFAALFTAELWSRPRFGSSFGFTIERPKTSPRAAQSLKRARVAA